MPTVRIRETYDLSTTTNRMGLIAVHTPSLSLLRQLYPGLVLQYKKVRCERCDVALASASLLPADPLQVGTEAGDIAPQDLFNPILYRAVSTDSFNTIVARVNAFNDMNEGSSLGVPGTVGNDPFTGLSNLGSEDVYYALLSEDGWKKAMPQSGLTMTNLVPLVYSIVNTFGNFNMVNVPSSLNKVITVSNTGNTNLSDIGRTFRGPAMRMPSVPTLASLTGETATVAGTSNSDWAIPVGTLSEIPKTFVSMFVLPPSKLHKLYFRMSIVWTVTFSELCSTVERGSLSNMIDAGATTYASQYEVPDDSKMTVHESTVDTQNVDAKMIMQS